MEMLWSKPKCSTCRHQNSIGYGDLGKPVDWRCDARQVIVENNKYYNRLGNCWYFEKK
jgi:hypothetical protein